MVTITLRANGSQQLKRTLVRWTEAITDLRPAYEEIADRFASMELLLFATEGASGGAPWAPLSPGYRTWKERNYPGRPILVRTGDLRRDLTRRPFGIEVITTDTLRVGAKVPYARYHQTGTPRMPRRPPVNLTEAQRQELVKIVQAYILGYIKNDQPRSR